MVATEFPGQVLAAHELTQAGVKRSDVVVLKVDLDEGLPVVVALVQQGAVVDVAAEIQLGCRSEPGEVVKHLAPVALEQQPFPVLQGVVAQVQARVLLEMRRADQLAVQVVGPAVQGADDVA